MESLLVHQNHMALIRYDNTLFVRRQKLHSSVMWNRIIPGPCCINLLLSQRNRRAHLMSHQPQASRPGHRAMTLTHPAMPRQKALQDIPHYHDYADPQPCAHQNTSNNPLAVCGHVSTVERDEERSGDIKCHKTAVRLGSVQSQ